MKLSCCVRSLAILLSAASLFALYGCIQPSNSDQLREQTAQTTAALKTDAKAIAQGVREGWSRDHPLDLNSASKDQLVTLPGITPALADRILAHRPYSKPDDLVQEHVLREAEYRKISDRVKVKG